MTISCNTQRKPQRLIKALAIVVIIILISLLIVYSNELKSCFSSMLTSEHHGLNYYNEAEYLQYEDADKFQEFLESLDFIEKGEVIDFYHLDNRSYDSIFYGKWCDFFSVDLKLTQQNYVKVKENLSSDWTCTPSEVIDDYVAYKIADLPEMYVLCFCDTENVIRCVIVTELDYNDSLAPLFYRNTSLQWTCDHTE